MYSGFQIDGTKYNVAVSVERNADMTPSEIAGMLLDKNYFNDVLGTFLSYTVSIAVPAGEEKNYAALYEVLTNPVQEHSFVFPYNQTTVSFYGRVETVSDSYYGEESRNGTTVGLWRGTKFTAIANHPTKQISLSEAVAAGISPLPVVSVLDTNLIYRVNESGEWEEYTPVNADENYY